MGEAPGGPGPERPTSCASGRSDGSGCNVCGRLVSVCNGCPSCISGGLTADVSMVMVGARGRRAGPGVTGVVRPSSIGSVMVYMVDRSLPFLLFNLCAVSARGSDNANRAEIRRIGLLRREAGLLLAESRSGPSQSRKRVRRCLLRDFAPTEECVCQCG